MIGARGLSGRMLAVLTLVNLFNYIDRFIVPGLAVTLRQSDLALSHAQIGALATGFILVYALASPSFGRLGDTRNRPRLISVGVGIWSVATVLGGFAFGFISLFIARAVLGIGEAAYGSVAPSLIADAYPRERRGRAFSIFYAAIPIGSAIGFLIAGAMAPRFGWRSAFFVAGAPGLLLSLWLLRLPELPRTAEAEPDAPTGAPAQDRAATYRDLFGNSRYVMTVLGYAAYTFAIGALATWIAAFLTEARGIPTGTADFETGAIAVVTGFVGTFAGGWLGDAMLRYTRHAYLLMSGVATLLAAPCTVVALTARDPHVFFPALIVAELLLFASTGPINSAIVNYVAPQQRATAMALSILAIHLLGDAPSPLIVGWISDRSSLATAVMILPAAIVVSGVIWIVGARPRRQDPVVG